MVTYRRNIIVIIIIIIIIVTIIITIIIIIVIVIIICIKLSKCSVRKQPRAHSVAYVTCVLSET